MYFCNWLVMQTRVRIEYGFRYPFLTHRMLTTHAQFIEPTQFI